METTELRRANNAIEWWERAANEATQKGAKIESLRLLQKAIDIWERLHKESTRAISLSLSNHSNPSISTFQVTNNITMIVSLHAIFLY